MAKASKFFTRSGGKHCKQNPAMPKESMMQLIRQCRDANKEAAGKHDFNEIIRRYYSVSP